MMRTENTFVQTTGGGFGGAGAWKGGGRAGGRGGVVGSEGFSGSRRRSRGVASGRVGGFGFGKDPAARAIEFKREETKP